MSGEVLPLSLAQREVWLDQMSWPGSAHLNIGGCGFLVGPLDVALYKAALRLLVQEVEALRLVPHRDGTQRLLDAFEPVLEQVDVSDAANPREAMRQWWQRKMREPFVLDGAPPWRFILLRGGRELHGITIQFHHLVMDGWGTTQIARRWSEIYSDLVAGGAPRIEPSHAFRDALAASIEARESAAYRADEAFWLHTLPAAPLPLFARAGERTELPEALIDYTPIARGEFAEFSALAKASGVSVFAMLLAAVALYFCRTRGVAEVVIGIPTANRHSAIERATPGMFVGVFALPLAIDMGASLQACVLQINRTLRAALPHARYPLSELSKRVHALGQRRESLFDVLLSFERQDYALDFGPVKLVESRQLFSGFARYPLGLTLCEFGAEQDLEWVLEGSAECFDTGTLRWLGKRLWHLLRRLARSPDTLAGEVDILPPEEMQYLVAPIERTPTPAPFITQFESQVERAPDALALAWAGGAMCYRELDQRATALACALKQQGVARGAIVALALERSADMIIALLAVAKAGAAFLPLDVDAPIARLAGIVKDAGAVMVLTQTAHLERMKKVHGRVLAVDAPLAPASMALPAPTPADLAYVLFTSGSTGQPKGVKVDHAALCLRLDWLAGAFGMTASDRTLQSTQLTFDPALIEVCLPLTCGASIALPPPGRLAAREWVDAAVALGASVMTFVPSTLARFVDLLPQASLKLRVACCGGEPLTAAVAKRFLRLTGARLINLYGPTEATIFATFHECVAGDADGMVPIGVGADDTSIYLMDAGRLVPTGEPGEIMIGGPGLALGYLARPELNAACFIDDPFQPGERLYRSGDLAWRDGAGALHFIGRRDRQIKLRGYRIELGEIEATLMALPGIRRAACKLDEDVIRAWVAGEGEDVRAQLAARLPDWMLPASITVMETLPETATGKIDFAALPRPAERVSAARTAPASALEIALVEAFSNVLKKSVSLQDNFFDQGGDSLAAIALLAEVEKIIGRRVSLYVLSEHPTVAELARALGSLAMTPMLTRLAGAGAAQALYLAASGEGDGLRFGALARELAGSFEVFMLQPPLDQARSLPALGERYGQAIAKRGGPCVVAGFSVGGLAALEAARYLLDSGHEVAALVLIDVPFPGALFRLARWWRAFGWLIRLVHLERVSVNGRRLKALFEDPGLAAQVRALGDYCPAPYPGRVVLIRSAGLIPWQGVLFSGWRQVCRGAWREVDTTGFHGGMFSAGEVSRLARAIGSVLA